MLAEQGGKAADAGVKQSIEASEAIRTLVSSVTEAAQASTQIAASSQQQLIGMEQVASAMENIKQASTESVSSTQQTEATARNLHKLSEKLLMMV
jgi:methyl-accepting chemotaxis protein